METCSTAEITKLLKAWGSGDRAVLEELVPLVRSELYRLARHYMAHERPGHLLQTTALVNEAYLRLIDLKNVSWKDRAHFFGLSARLMRNILVDLARRRPRLAGGRDAHQITFEDALVVFADRSEDLVALDEALKNLEAFDLRKIRIVELRFFGGLSVREAAEVLKISERTLMREWSAAKAWLLDELSTKECLEA